MRNRRRRTTSNDKTPRGAIVFPLEFASITGVAKTSNIKETSVSAIVRFMVVNIRITYIC